MKVFVSGGTGFVGKHLCRALREKGYAVRLLVHRRGGGAEEGVELFEGDLCDPSGFAPALAGCDAVINLVGIIREFPSRGVTFERLHVEATRNLVAAAEEAGVQRYLHMSALGTRENAVSGYHRSKWGGEEIVRRSRLDWTIFRPSLIFGPGDAFINMLAAQLRLAPVLPLIGSGDYRLQPIHADDVARCFASALSMPATVRQSYELCGRDRISYSDLLDRVALAIGHSPPLKPHLPLWLMRPLIRLLERIELFPITSDQLQMLLEENIGSSDWQGAFGFEPTGLSEGIGRYLTNS